MNELKFTILVFSVFINTCIMYIHMGGEISIFIMGVHSGFHIIHERYPENDTESNAVEVILVRRGRG
jgi:hypothetical protein